MCSLLVCDDQQGESATGFDVAARFSSGESGLETPFMDSSFSACSGPLCLCYGDVHMILVSKCPCLRVTDLRSAVLFLDVSIYGLELGGASG